MVAVGCDDASDSSGSGAHQDAGLTTDASGSDVDANVQACDGTEELRLAVVYDGQIGRQQPYSGVLYELGAPFLYVDGKCRYWVGSWDGADRLQEWRPWHTGTLTSSEVEALSRAVRYDQLSSLGKYCMPSQLNDKPVAWISNGRVVVGCDNTSGELASALSDVAPLAAALYERGENVAGGVRIEVGAKSFAPVTKLPPHAWPLSRPVSELVVAEDAAFDAGQSTLFADPVSIEALRKLRASFIAEQEALNPREPGIQIEGGYIVFMRDEIPLSNAVGLITLESNP